MHLSLLCTSIASILLRNIYVEGHELIIEEELNSLVHQYDKNLERTTQKNIIHSPKIRRRGGIILRERDHDRQLKEETYKNKSNTRKGERGKEERYKKNDDDDQMIITTNKLERKRRKKNNQMTTNNNKKSSRQRSSYNKNKQKKNTDKHNTNHDTDDTRPSSVHASYDSSNNRTPYSNYVPGDVINHLFSNSKKEDTKIRKYDDDELYNHETTDDDDGLELQDDDDYDYDYETFLLLDLGLPTTEIRQVKDIDGYCPSERYLPWDKITSAISGGVGEGKKKGGSFLLALSELEYTENNWNKFTNKNEEIDWETLRLESASKAYSGYVMGYKYWRQWDCCLNHFSAYDWDELIEVELDDDDDDEEEGNRKKDNSVIPYVQLAYSILGYDELNWDPQEYTNNEGVIIRRPESEDKYWRQLRSFEQAAGTYLCYHEDLWDGRALPFWSKYPTYNQSPPKKEALICPLIRNSSWQELSEYHIGLLENVMGYSEQTWNMFLNVSFIMFTLKYVVCL